MTLPTCSCGRGMLARQYTGARITRSSTAGEYSLDGGKTWHAAPGEATLTFDQPGTCLVCPVCDSPDVAAPC